MDTRGHEHGLRGLHVRIHGEYRPLPTWIEYLCAVADHVVNALHDGRLSRVFLIVPTRRTLAGFITGQICLRRAHEGVLEDQWWLDAKPGQAVRVVGKRVQVGIFDGTEERHGRSYLRLMTEDSSTRNPDGKLNLIPVDHASKVVPVGDEVRLPKTQKGRAVSGSAGVVRDLLGKLSAQYLATSTVSTVMVGSRSALRDGVEEVQLRSASGAEASLAGLVRVKEFGNARSYRARWVSSRGSADLPDDAVVVFNGATDFVAGAFDHLERPWITLVERSAPSLELAVQTLDGLYLSSGAPLSQVAPDTPMPAGVEILAFEEGR